MSLQDTVNAAGEPKKIATTLKEVFERWKTSGPLVHELMGLKFDELTGGGPIYGSRWYFLGAPDAGKTLLLAHVGHSWAQRKIAIGLLAVDEEADDLATRFVQRVEGHRFSRSDCERRDPAQVAEMEQALADLPIRIYGPEVTIEDAAQDLGDYAESLGVKAVLFVDSVQVALCAAIVAAEREMSERQVVTANVRAIRSESMSRKMLIIATSEMNRQAYRTIKSAEENNDMAAGKESGAIEYSGRVIVSLRRVEDHPDLIKCRMVKNKHGSSWPGVEDFFLKFDRATQSVEDTDAPTDNEQSAEVAKKFHDQSVGVWNVIIGHPGVGIKELRALTKDAGVKISKDTLDEVLLYLVHERKIENRPVPYGQKTRDTWWAISDDVPRESSKEPVGKYDMVETEEDLDLLHVLNGVSAANGAA
jgi:KaiC/GvpD/RAD55 family RecA-like ATPase